MNPFDHSAPAADRHHGAGGQCRDRQDVHRRRPGHPLRGRGAHHHRARCWWSRSAGWPVRNCANGSGTSWSRWNGGWPTRPPPESTCRTRCCNCWPRPMTPRWRSVAAGSPPRWPHFDTATIATTHQFCQQVLIGLGVAGDSEPGAALVENLDELVVEVVDDLYVRGFARPEADEPVFTRAGALATGPGRGPRPAGPAGTGGRRAGSPADMRRRFAQAVRLEVDRRKRSRGLLGYDDLLSRLAGALEPADAAGSGPDAVALVSRAGRRIPGHRPRAVGRAATGLRRTRHADPDRRSRSRPSTPSAAATSSPTWPPPARPGPGRRSPHNWRSDAPLVAALQSLMGGAELGDPEIVVRPVAARRMPSLGCRAPRHRHRCGCGWCAAIRSGSAPEQRSTCGRCARW